MNSKEKTTINITWLDGKTSTLKDVDANETYEVDYTRALVSAKNINPNIKQWLNKTNNSKIAFTHKEDNLDYYKTQILLPHSQSNVGPSSAKGDANDDGLEDIYIGGAAGQVGALFIQKSNSTFELKQGPWSLHKVSEDTGGVFFDADSDGDLDLYIVSGGAQKEEGSFFYTDRLYFNDGKGNFAYKSKALPKINSSSKAVVASDIDNDGDTDLFIGGRVIPDK